mmetsp:Transcript_25594/g.33487  ORF Transcript_25594/g.33487 Transcript_25594/m.33487 type:complete len:96 (-) Transcript_25594:79-366(-)
MPTPHIPLAQPTHTNTREGALLTPLPVGRAGAEGSHLTTPRIEDAGDDKVLARHTRAEEDSSIIAQVTRKSDPGTVKGKIKGSTNRPLLKTHGHH